MELQRSDFKVNTDVQIRFNDIDGLGHVNNSVYSQYFDQGRMHYFNILNDNQPVDWHEARLIIASTHIEFMRPIFLDENIEVLSKIYKLGNKSLKMLQHLIDKETGEIKASCKSVMVGFDPKTKQSLQLSEKWRSAIDGFEGL
jgi:acyl-CoA thioester hydrolase